MQLDKAPAYSFETHRMLRLLKVFVAWLKSVFLIGLLAISKAHALDQINFGIAKITAPAWQLQKLNVVLENAPNNAQRLTLTADQLILPAPLDKITLVNLRCSSLSTQNGQLQCREGSVEFGLNGIQTKAPRFSFLLGAGNSFLHIPNLRIAKGRISIEATDQNGQWQVTIKAQKLSLTALRTLFKTDNFTIKKGEAAVLLILDGNAAQPQNAKLTTHLRNTSIQTKDGRYASENTDLDSYLQAQNQKSGWSWQGHTALNKGAIYIDPVYIEAPVPKPIVLDGVGYWSEKKARWFFDYLQYNHPGVATLTAHGSLVFAAEKWLKSAEINLRAQKLQRFTNIYSAPFLLGSALDGVTFSGQLQTKATFQEQALSAFHLEFQHLDLNDPKQRLSLQQASASLDWKIARDFNRTGFLKWRQLKFYALPLGAVQLNLNIKADSVELLKPVDIAFLDGIFAIHRFQWRARTGQTPEVHFAGALQAISLERLSKALDWTPLTGQISGIIPGIGYQNDRLKLEGALNIQVFGGKITVNQLAVAKIFSDKPKFYSDIEIERLNLKQLTEKFKFGSIEGLLSGYIKDLYLENWRPVSFYAWLGTPEGDTTAHRISQKAVDNIASIGGGGATDLISRSVLGLFDSFGYDRLGLGCYLHAGVCQLMGLAPAQNGYYMIKGGGLPKIDVIGYNPRVDWKVLVDRLGRVGSSDNVIIE